jgi:hypothetical protein
VVKGRFLMTKNISEQRLYKLRDYENASLAQLIICYAIDNSYSLIDLAKAANVSRMTIHNWIDGLKVRNRNLAALVVNLEISSVLEQIISPSPYADRFSAGTIKSYAQLKVELLSLKKELLKIELEKTDVAMTLMQKKYFKYFGREMISAALDGHWNFDPIVLPWDDEDACNISTDTQYADFCLILKEELEADGFEVDIDEGPYSLSETLIKRGETLHPMMSENQVSNLKNLNKKIDNVVFLEIGWLDAETSGDDNFAWFLEWLHTPGQILIENIFKKIEDLTAKSVHHLDLPFYTICEDDYDFYGSTVLKLDEFSYREDEKSLYYEGLEFPVNEAYLRVFFLLKGFRFILNRDARGPNQHIASIDW